MMRVLKFGDLISFKTVQVLYKARKKLLPCHLQKLFIDREGKYNLRGKFNFKIQCVRTTMKSFNGSIRGVKLWNSLPENIKYCSNIQQFKKAYKESCFEEYRKENNLAL